MAPIHECLAPKNHLFGTAWYCIFTMSSYRETLLGGYDISIICPCQKSPKAGHLLGGETWHGVGGWAP